MRVARLRALTHAGLPGPDRRSAWKWELPVLGHWHSWYLQLYMPTWSWWKWELPVLGHWHITSWQPLFSTTTVEMRVARLRACPQEIVFWCICLGKQKIFFHRTRNSIFVFFFCWGNMLWWNRRQERIKKKIGNCETMIPNAFHQNFYLKNTFSLRFQATVLIFLSLDDQKIKYRLFTEFFKWKNFWCAGCFMIASKSFAIA